MVNTNKSKILLGIGLPVYNGEKYISETIESILNQTMKDFRLIISDNASTDRTEEICRSYTDIDERIVYVRNPVNIGLVLNTAKAFEKSQPSKYFALIGDDDLWRPKFAKTLISMMENNPLASLAFSRSMFIDEDGHEIIYKRDYAMLNAKKLEKEYKHTQKRFLQNRRQRISFQPPVLLIHSIIRTTCFDTSLFLNRYGLYEDVFMLRAFAAQGPFLLHQDILFKKRIHGQNFSGSYEYKQENRKIHCFIATKELKRLSDLSLFEAMSLWCSLVWFFKVKRLFIKNWYRGKKLCRIALKPLSLN